MARPLLTVNPAQAAHHHRRQIDGKADPAGSVSGLRRDTCRPISTAERSVRLPSNHSLRIHSAAAGMAAANSAVPTQ